MAKLRAIRDIFVLGGGTAVGQFAMAASTPIVTRLYHPSDIGLFTLYFAFVSFAQSGSSLMYAAAIPGASSDEEASRLHRIARMVTIPYAFAFGGLLELLRAGDVAGFGFLPPAIGLAAALSLILTGWFTANRYLMVRENKFSVVGRLVATQSATRAFGQVLLAIPCACLAALVAADVCARAIGGLRRLRDGAASIPHRDLRVTAQKFSSYPKVYLPSVLTDTLVAWLPLPIITAIYGTVEAGYYAVVSRIALIPLSLIGSAVADVFHGRIATAARQSDSAPMQEIFWRTVVGLAMIGLPFAGLLAFTAGDFIPLVLGDGWDMASPFFAAMAPWLLAQFIVSPVSRLVLVLGGQYQKLAYDASAFVLTCGVAALSLLLQWPATACVWALSIANFLAYGVYFGVLVHLLRKDPQCAV